MIHLGLWLLILGVSAAQAASFNQQTDGACSPIVGQTGGNVTLTINCPGVDPKALDALHRELGLSQGQLRHTNQQLEQKTKEANEWARKYHELSRQAQFIQDSNITPQAEDLLRQGRLQEADSLLKRSTVSMAQYHALQEGMSYQQVVNILGRPGVENGRGGSLVGYTWKNPDGSMLVANFIDGRMTVKVPANLR